MNGTESLLPLAKIGIPTARDCLMVAIPILTVMAVRWLFFNIDPLIHRLFPDLEWEKQLGWLNIRAHRRADRIWRWLGYFFYLLLAVALYGIVWAAPVLGELGQMEDPSVVADLGEKLPVLLMCSGLWLVYLGLELIPKLRRQYEEEDLQKFREEQVELDRAKEQEKKAARFNQKLPVREIKAARRPDRLGPGQ